MRRFKAGDLALLVVALPEFTGTVVEITDVLPLGDKTDTGEPIDYDIAAYWTPRFARQHDADVVSVEDCQLMPLMGDPDDTEADESEPALRAEGCR